MKLVHALCLLILSLVLTACATTGGARVSEPDASIQQIQVDANGRWNVTMRLQNYSSVEMRFDTIALTARFNEATSVPLNANPGLTIPAESADVFNLQITPDAQAKLFIADALISGRSVPYTLGGQISAAPGKSGVRSYPLESKHNQLSPVPGLTGTLR